MPILSIKFRIPIPRKDYIVRKHLMVLLEDITSKKVSIIKAGAGSGKTTLLSTFIKEKKLSDTFWITLDENMNQVFVFWRYLLEATKDVIGESYLDFKNLFDGTMQKDNLWTILPIYLNQLNQSKEIILVLDDFQLITDEYLITTFDFFISNMPLNMHLVLLTRQMPKLYLATVSMENQLLLLDDKMLQMTKEECKEFLEHTLNLSVEEEELWTMIQTSNGWVGGLQLMAAARGKERTPSVLNPDTSEKLIQDYITNEIYCYLSKEEQKFLKYTSILGYFNQKICESFIPDCSFSNMMQSIMKKNLFVVLIDHEQEVYHYHSIMENYLVGLLEQEDQLKHSLHAKAAQIYEEIKDYEECLKHLFQIMEYEHIMELLLKMPQTSLTFSYMMKVPMNEITKNIDFAYQYFFCYYASLDINRCEKIYAYMMENKTKDEIVAAFHHADMFFDVNWKMKQVSCVSLKEIDSFPMTAVSKAYLLIKEAYFLFLQENNNEAIEYLDKAHEIFLETGSIYIEVFILTARTQVLEAQGELKLALLYYKKMSTYMEYIPTLKPAYYIGLAGVYIRQFALDTARDMLKLADSHMKLQVESVRCAYLYTKAELYYIEGEYKKTEQIITEIGTNEVYQNIYFTARLLRYPIYRGNNKILSKQFLADYEVADEIVKSMDTDILYIGILNEHKRKQESLNLINELIAKARKKQNKLKIIEGILLKIHIVSEQDQFNKDLLNLFIEAVTYAYENKIAHPFWFEKEQVKLILKHYQKELSKKLAEEELNFVYEIISSDSKKGISTSTNYEFDLTKREWEVLEEMKRGCSNKEIAEHLCISLATVKSHIINIYSKLQVNNRVAAINKLK